MKKILVAYDGGGPAQRALELGVELARMHGAMLGIVSVTPFRSFAEPDDSWDEGPIHNAALIEARRFLESDGLEAEIYEPTGNAAGAIEEIARTGAYDTIVVGSRGLGTVDRILQGSVSGHVATHASATVIVAR
jgi:nucleotide-binding universal stress UspA family protein